MPSECPDRDSLRDFLLGKLGESQVEELESHLVECPRCVEVAETVEHSDTITDAGRDPLHLEDDDSLLQAAIEKAKQLTGSAPSLAGGETVRFNDESTDATGASHDRAVEIDFLSPPEEPDELGRLGGYRVLKILGSGGMGLVFRAEDPVLKRQIALKVMKPQVALDPVSKDRFLKEAQATAAIEHDHIVTIHQVGEEAGVPFIAMRYLKGESLQARLNREKILDQKEVLRIGRQIASGLGAAHERGLIHRDIKPDNIWLEKGTGRVKIVDFGLVRSTAADVELTQSGMVLGSPKYMSPEQAEGKPVDHRSDLFSLGSVLYHLASGKAPFEAESITATLMAVAHHDAEPIHTLCPEIDPSLAGLIMKLLSKHCEERPQSAEEVVSDLKEIEQNLLSDAEAPPPTGIFRGDGPGDGNVDGANRSFSAKPDASRNGILKTVVIIALILGLPSLVYLGITSLFKIETDEGTLVVELEGAIASEVLIDGKKANFEFGEDGKTLLVKVNAGERTLALRTADGVELATSVGNEPVTINAGKKRTIKAWLEPVGVAKNDDLRSSAKPAIQIQNSKAETANDSALEFDGKDDYVQIGTSFRLKSEAYTLEGWFSTEVNEYLQQPLALRRNGLFLDQFGRWKYSRYNPELGKYEHSGSEKPTLLQGMQHVALCRSGKSWRLFVQGREVSNESAPAIVADTKEFQTELFIGAYWPALDDRPWHTAYKGLIDEVRISNIARYDKDFTPVRRFENDEHTLALYHFDEGCGEVLKDSSGNDHHGNIVDAKWVHVSDDSKLIEEPPQNYALEFGGEENRVEIPSLNKEGNIPFTIEATIQTTDRDGYMVNGSPLVFFLHRGCLRMSVVAPDKGQYSVVTTSPLPERESYHVCAVYDQQDLLLFVDGKRQEVRRLIDFKPLPDSSKIQVNPSPWKPLVIGRHTQGGYGFQGIIDELRISNIARYDKDFTPAKRLQPDEHTLALYHFDEGTGNEVKDASGNGHHGKIVGAKWVRVDYELRVIESYEIQGDRDYFTALKNLGARVDFYYLDRIITDAMNRATKRLTAEAHTLVSPGKLENVKTLMMHPNVFISFSGSEFGNEQLQKLAAIVRQRPKDAPVLNLTLAHTDITADGLAVLSGMKFSKIEIYGDIEINKSGVECLRDIRPIHVLVLAHAGLDDEGFQRLLDGSQFGWLHVPGNDLTDEALKSVKGSKVTILNVGDNAITDAGLKHLQGMSQLTNLYLEKTKVTATGVRALHKAIPQCEIQWDGGTIEAKPPADESYNWPKDQPAPAIAPFTAEEAKKHQEAWAKHLGVPVEMENSIGMKFRMIPPGEFLMGSSEAEIADARKEAAGFNREKVIATEGPQHAVTITQPFAIGTHEVTRSQFRQFIDATKYKTDAEQDGGGWGFRNGKWVIAPEFRWDSDLGFEMKPTDEHSVVNVSWNDAVAFCNWLSGKEGVTYGLPSEAEWEYAGSAGTRSRYYFGNDDAELGDHVWNSRTSGVRSTQAVGLKKSNNFGLFDIQGNVSEWCQNYRGKYDRQPVIDPRGNDDLVTARGGGFPHVPFMFRSSYRQSPTSKTNRYFCLGFRVTRRFSNAKSAALGDTEYFAKLAELGAEVAYRTWGEFEKQKLTHQAILQHSPHIYLYFTGKDFGDAQLRSFVDLYRSRGPDAAAQHISIRQTSTTPAGLKLLKGLRIGLVSLGAQEFDPSMIETVLKIDDLWGVDLQDMDVTDEDVERLSTKDSLIRVSLNRTRVTAEGIRHLTRLPLTTLDVKQLGLGNDSLEQMGKIKTLIGLFLNHNAISDDGLKHLRGLSNLQGLYLTGNKITDDGLLHLGGLRNLQFLDLQQTKVTAKGVAELHKTLPNCEIFWDGRTSEPVGKDAGDD